MSNLLYMRKLPSNYRESSFWCPKWAYQAAVKAGELRLLAESRLGELLGQEIRHKGGRPKNGYNDVTVLRNLGLSNIESHRAQRVARYKDKGEWVVDSLLAAKKGWSFTQVFER